MTRLQFTILSLASLIFTACGDKPTGSAAATPAPVAQPENPENPQIKIVTSAGTITAELYKDRSPITVENFLKYMGEKHFDNTVFHRVIKGFMIQGGGFENQNGNFVQKATKDPIKNEATNGLKNRRGTLAMARTNDPHSATDQFFINTADNGDKLGPGGVSPDGYAVFGKVLAGMEVVDKIENEPTTTRTLTNRQGENLLPGPSQDVPVRNIVIESISALTK
jgi:cyclophilin family peptidyl-prolyl cis-trans isomerase